MKKLAEQDNQSNKIINVANGTNSNDAVNKSQLDTKSNISNTVTMVNHGSNASTARPTGYALVIWVGTVNPNNRATGDIFCNVS